MNTLATGPAHGGLNLPNLLTLSRVAAVPILAAALLVGGHAGYRIAFAIYCAASVTDYLDGHFARTQGTVSRLGTFLDPIADKVMVGAVLLMMVATDDIAGWHLLPALVILLREIVVSGLREFLGGLQVSVPVTRLAKWKTAVQMVALGALILAGAVAWPALPVIALSLLWIAAGLTLLTGTQYLRAGLRHMA
jgi:CDP-diacylglycerol--glycerol-3-phosphate 3-phosphatidyltransferase/cardiolipin synthase